MRFEGTLKTWNDDRGFGFIEPDQGGGEVFVHIKAFPRTMRPQLAQRVSFEVERDAKGKKRARSVAAVLQPRPAARTRQRGPAQWGTATLLAIPAFLLLCLAVALAWRPSGWFAAAYAALSVVTFVMYAADKSAARSGGRRTPESTLHLLALAGGWPGALLAQQFLRHKSTKTEFRGMFWVTVILNVAGFVLLCSPLGREWLRQTGIA
ncbi:cold shock and DUF1294 domain-containing protein [Ramlibacter sp.]|uniref:cold shock and DUF1294 domain-containing protein n=1 Tax=Ramlibacter sp. TaxID=1917967 RepID=UPI002FC96DF0